jgi:trans-aconitate methyltransferase
MNTNQAFSPDAFSQLYEWEKGNFWFQTRNDRIIYLIKKYFREPFKFLEIGCGTGYVIEGLHHNFPNSSFSGSEFYSEGLEIARLRNPDLEFVQMDARNIPYKKQLDGIGAFDVIEHIEEDEIVLQQIHKALKRNGLLFISVPQHKFLWSNVDEIAYHKRRYSKEELILKVKKSGFEILDVNSFTSLLFP